MKNIDYLKSGDCVALAAPARKISPQETAAFKCALENEGYNVLETPHLYGEFHQFSGTDAERAADFQWALDNPEIRAIFCVRGGYGGMRIVDSLDFSAFIEHPKWICGYSDTTVFLSHLHGLGFPSLHAVMPVNITEQNVASASMKTLFSALKGEKLKYTTPFHPLNRMGKANAGICGGNLSILYAIQGSSSALETAGKILFIEDLDEYLYHIDRMMLNLKRSGILDNLAGLLVGNMSEMHDNAIPFGKTAEEIVYDYVKEYEYPICFGFSAGHADASYNLALPFGVTAKMEVGPNGSRILIG